MFDLSQLLLVDYYLYPAPGGDFILGYPLLFFFLALLFVVPLVQKFAPQNKYFRKSIKGRLGRFMAVGSLGLIAVLARFGTVPYFSMRLFLYILFLLSLFLIVWTWLQVRKDYHKRIESSRREKKKQGKAVV